MSIENKRILYVTLRPLDSRDIFVPLIQEVSKNEPGIKQSAISPYLWIFPDQNRDQYLDVMGVDVIHRSNDYASFDQQFHEYASKWKPDLVVVQIDYPGIYQNVVLWARERGIKTLVCASESIFMYASLGLDKIVVDQHTRGYFDNEQSIPHLLTRLMSEIKYFSRKVPLALSSYIKQSISRYRHIKYKNDFKKYACMSGAEAYVVSGDRDRNILRSLLPDNDHIYKTGWIRGEKVQNENVMDRKMVCQTLGFSSSQKYVLLVSQCFSRSRVAVKSDHHLELLKTIRHVKKAIPDCKFVLTLHPSEDAEAVSHKIHEYVDDVVMVKGFADRLALAKYSELLIGYYSTALFEAMFVSRPIVTLDYVLLQNRQPYLLEYGAVCPVLHERDLSIQISRVFGDRDYTSSMLANQKVLLNDVVGDCKGSIAKVVDAMFLLLISKENQDG